MATKNIVPRGTGEGNIGTTLKHWLKGWFDSVFTANGITDGTDTVTVAEMRAAVDTARWNTITPSKYTATPANPSTITMSDTSDMKVGLPILYTDSRGTFRAQVMTVTTDTSIAIRGGALTVVNDLTALSVGTAELIVTMIVEFGRIENASAERKIWQTLYTVYLWRRCLVRRQAQRAVRSNALAWHRVKVNNPLIVLHGKSYPCANLLSARQRQSKTAHCGVIWLRSNQTWHYRAWLRANQSRHSRGIFKPGNWIPASRPVTTSRRKIRIFKPASLTRARICKPTYFSSDSDMPGQRRN